MNRIHRHSICWLMCPALLLLSACSQNEESGQESDTFVPVQISGATLQSEVATRAAAPLTTGSIGVFNTTSSSGYIKVYNAQYTYADAAWSSATPITVAGYPATLCAYHPYGAARFTPETTLFELSAQLYSADQDLSYAPMSAATEVNNNDPNVAFGMVRGYAKFSLAITRQAGYVSGPCKISNITLKQATGLLQATRTLDISNGNYTDKTGLESLSFTNLGALQNTGIPSGGATSLHLLLPPQTLSAELHLLLTIDGAVHSLAIDPLQLMSWEAGTAYEMSISVNETGVSVSSVSTEDWTNKEIDGGTTPGTPYEAPYVVLPSIGLRVAKGNLMREGGKGRWYQAPDQGQYTGSPAGGDYFCWGIDDPTVIGNGFGSNMDLLSAGCASVRGYGWRVPTKSDFEDLAKVAHVWGTYSSQLGSRNGMYFGTTTAPDASSQDKYVFLPAAGSRWGNGHMPDVGTVSSYWSSEPEYGPRATGFQSSGTEPFGPTSPTRESGLPVRCVADN